MGLCAFIFGVLDCDFNGVFGDLCHPDHQYNIKIRNKDDPPGIGNNGDITPLEPLFGILRDLLSVGV